jgi:hypothetical protein
MSLSVYIVDHTDFLKIFQKKSMVFFEDFEEENKNVMQKRPKYQKLQKNAKKTTF